MNRHVAILGTLLLPIVTGCSSASHATSTPSQAAISSAATSIANGRSIFLTGRGSSGQQIHAQPPALYPSCAACHRPNGSGGIDLPTGAVSADLRYEALVASQRHPYTLALLERAISTGVDNDGQPLNPMMPRWRLSSRDLHDVANYVLTMLK
jgi:mono/diheme cytochrome c family protein